MIYKPIASLSAALVLALLLATGASAQVLVGDVFVTGYDGWTDMIEETGSSGGYAPAWGVLLTDSKALSDNSDGRAGNGAAARDGKYKPYLMVNKSEMTPSSYTLSAKIGQWDNDGFGLVFGFQDADNYCRIGFRNQANGSYGFPEGVSMQTISGGTITFDTADWYSGGGSWVPHDGTLMDVVLDVDGATGDYSITIDGATTPILSGVNTNLIGKTAGYYGVHTWYARQDSSSTDKYRGALFQDISVASDTFNKTTTFYDASPVAWRPLFMTNAEGVGLVDGQSGGTDWGNFRLDFRDGTITDDSNGFDNATVTAPNTDFTGPAVVVDEPGNEAWSDYKLKVRMANGDDDGIGLLVRVQDDKTFYRINFASQGAGTGDTRPPAGMSIQKCIADGENPPIWTTLFSEDTPLFDPTNLLDDGETVPFDVEVTVIGNKISVTVIDDPDGSPEVITYDTVVDTDNPILTGSVGFTNWGSGYNDNAIDFSAYGGQAGAPLVTAIPEPTTLMLLGLLGVCSLAVRRRK